MLRKASGAVAAIALVASIIAANPATAAGVAITGEGSSFANTYVKAVEATFNAKGGAQANYTKSKSGTGRANVATGKVQFAFSDATYKGASETVPTNVVTTPMFGGPIAVVYNLPTIGQGLQLDAKTLGSIFDGTITAWNDAAIKKLNPGKTLPAKAIQVVYRSSGSGTTSNFTEYLTDNKVNKWSIGSDFTKASGAAAAVGVSVADSASMVSKIDTVSYTIGYVDLADAEGKDLVYAKIKNPAGKYVAPSAAAAKPFLAGQTIPTDGQVNIDFAKKTSATAYNLTIFVYGIASTSDDADKVSAVKSFFTNVLAAKAPAGYVALSGAAKAAALKQIAKIVKK